MFLHTDCLVINAIGPICKGIQTALNWQTGAQFVEYRTPTCCLRLPTDHKNLCTACDIHSDCLGIDCGWDCIQIEEY